ncbi:MAG TPA: universal stress protein [Streptosporangiales bacterium]
MSEPSHQNVPTLLVAVDGSQTSLRAGAYAAGMARRQGARIVCLYVHTIGVFTGLGAETVRSQLETQNAIAEELRKTVETESARLGIDVAFVERKGNPYTEIVRLADEIRSDAVIVGASSQAGHRFVGSLATHLVRDARWPVTVVP